MAVQSIDPRRCMGCKTCVTTCPTDVFRYDAKSKQAVAKYPTECQLCHMCVNYCPVGAITVTSDKETPILTCWG